MKHNLHTAIPNWMIKAVENSSCNECSEKLSKEDILGIGIKEIKEDKVCMYVEFQCSHCQHPARMNFSSPVGKAEEV